MAVEELISVAVLRAYSMRNASYTRFPPLTCALTVEERTYVAHRSSLCSMLNGNGHIDDFHPLMAVARTTVVDSSSLCMISGKGLLQLTELFFSY